MDWPKQLCTTRLLDQNFGMSITPQDIIMPFYNFPPSNYFRPWKVLKDSADKDCGSTIDNTKDNFKIILDVQHFLPHEINVKVIENEVKIEGKHEERPDDHGFISRQFVRRYVLPMDCKTETLTSTLSSDGILTIIAKKTTPIHIKDNEKNVPIKICGASPKQGEEIKISTVTQNGTSNVREETVSNTTNKKDSQILKEEHCRLLKSDVLKETVSGTEKLLSESRKETDELMTLIASDKPTMPTAGKSSGKLEEALGQCQTTIAELKEMVSEASMKGASDMSSLKCNISETVESMNKLSSTSKSSTNMTSSVKMASETSEIMCTDLNKGAE